MRFKKNSLPARQAANFSMVLRAELLNSAYEYKINIFSISGYRIKPREIDDTVITPKVLYIMTLLTVRVHSIIHQTKFLDSFRDSNVMIFGKKPNTLEALEIKQEVLESIFLNAKINSISDTSTPLSLKNLV